MLMKLQDINGSTGGRVSEKLS